MSIPELLQENDFIVGGFYGGKINAKEWCTIEEARLYKTTELWKKIKRDAQYGVISVTVTHVWWHHDNNIN
jgi:hypothetical protein